MYKCKAAESETILGYLFYDFKGLRNALGEATEKGDIEKVKMLMEKVNVGDDVKIKREGLGKSPLLIACTYGQVPVVEEFLQVLS